MYYALDIIMFSFLCLVVNGNECIRPTDIKVNQPNEAYQRLEEDAHNVTKHIDVYITKLREILRNDDLPPNSVKYYLFTSEKPKEPYNLTTNRGSFRNIPYDNRKPLAFGIHGYSKNASLLHGLMGDLVQAVLKLNKYNVIFVDYSNLNHDILSVATPKAYLAAKDMVRFLQLLMYETGTKREHIHVIGESLGGQMSGIIGHYLPGLGRITGLDPGGLFFRLFPKDLRLDRGDAKFVDVIHTSDAYPFPKGWGYYPPCGHLDFYPNGGKFQPGCGSTIPIEETPTTVEEKDARLCMHLRLATYYIESTCNTCAFFGTLCESYEKFKEGKCAASQTAIMGEFAAKPIMDLPEDAMFFLDTNAHYPFCKTFLTI